MIYLLFCVLNDVKSDKRLVNEWAHHRRRFVGNLTDYQLLNRENPKAPEREVVNFCNLKFILKIFTLIQYHSAYGHINFNPSCHIYYFFIILIITIIT